MPVQTTYSNTVGPAIAGLVADATPNRITSFVAQISPVPFGSAVYQGTSDSGAVIAGTPGAGTFLGVATIAKEVRPGGVIADSYNVGATMAVLEVGAVWVTTGAAVTPEQPVYLDANGNFTSTSSGNTLVPNSVFLTTAAAGALARIGLRIR